MTSALHSRVSTEKKEGTHNYFILFLLTFCYYLHLFHYKSAKRISKEKKIASLMETMEQQRHSLSSLPMLSRLEHLDFVVNRSITFELYVKRQFTYIVMDLLFITLFRLRTGLFLMQIKNLERQQNLPKWKDESASTTRGLIDRGTVVREAYFKGSLLDRIAALETRLFQVWFYYRFQTKVLYKLSIVLRYLYIILCLMVYIMFIRYVWNWNRAVHLLLQLEGPVKHQAKGLREI